MRRDGRFGTWPIVVGRSLLIALAVLGLLAGLFITAQHLTRDPLADVRAYYDAGDRLNRGLPLYAQTVDTTQAEFYRYPPLLAILFRPLALLPYPVAAACWEVLVLAAFAATLALVGLNRRTALVVAFLALPIGWALAIGQAQSVVTLLLAVAAPWSVALAAHLKLLPALVAVYWLARGDWRRLGAFLVWGAALLAFQFVLEPAGTMAFLSFTSLSQVGNVNNLSPYAISQVAWVAFAGALAVMAWRLAPTRYGWAAAVVFSVLATPRLLSYMLSTLLAGLRPDPTPQTGLGTRPMARRS